MPFNYGEKTGMNITDVYTIRNSGWFPNFIYKSAEIAAF